MLKVVDTKKTPPLGRRFRTNDMEAVIGIMAILPVPGTINVFSSSFVIAEAECKIGAQ